jgi:hypothetical protein
MSAAVPTDQRPQAQAEGGLDKLVVQNGGREFIETYR